MKARTTTAYDNYARDVNPRGTRSRLRARRTRRRTSIWVVTGFRAGNLGFTAAYTARMQSLHDRVARSRRSTSCCPATWWWCGRGASPWSPVTGRWSRARHSVQISTIRTTNAGQSFVGFYPADRLVSPPVAHHPQRRRWRVAGLNSASRTTTLNGRSFAPLSDSPPRSQACAARGRRRLLGFVRPGVAEVGPVAQKDDCTPSQRNQGRHVAYVPTRCGVHFAPGLWRSW